MPRWGRNMRWLVGQLIVPSNLGLSGTGQISFSHRCRRAVCVCDMILRACFVADCLWKCKVRKIYSGALVMTRTMGLWRLPYRFSVLSLYQSRVKNNNKEIQRDGAG